MMMKNKLKIIFILMIPLLISGCEFIGDVFKTGIWAGIIIIIAVIAVIAFIVKLFSK